jgi:hypothetical protein
MSRTYRRKNKVGNHWADLAYYTGEYVRIGYDLWWPRVYVPFDKQSKEYKKGVAKFHSDAGTTNCKEPGPSWFRNLYTERPLRRQSKREIRKFMLDPDYEPIIDKKGKLEYWT